MRTQFLAAAAAACVVAVSASNAFAADREPDAASAPLSTSALALVPEQPITDELIWPSYRQAFAPEIKGAPPSSVTALKREDLERAKSPCLAEVCAAITPKYENYNPSSGPNGDNWGIRGIGRVNFGRFAVDGDLGYNRTNGTGFSVDTTDIEAAAVYGGDSWEAGPVLGYHWNHSDFTGFTVDTNSFNYGAYAIGYPTESTQVGVTVGGVSGTHKTGGWYVGAAAEQQFTQTLAGRVAVDYTDFDGPVAREIDYTAQVLVNVAVAQVFAAYTRSDFQNNFHVDTFALGVTLYVATVVELQRQLMFGHVLRSFQPLKYRF